VSYIKLAVAIINFIIAFLRYMETAEKDQRKIEAKAIKFMKFRNALKEAEGGNGDGLEEMFTIMRPAKSSVSDDSGKKGTVDS